MKYTKYSKYVADLADELSLEDLLNALSDYLLESGFQNSMYFQQMDEHTLDALREAIRQALEMGDFMDQQMRERLEQMQMDGTLEELVEKLKKRGYRIVGENYERSYWKEAFISPRNAHGTVIQLAESDRPEQP